MSVRSRILTALAVASVAATPLALAGGAIAHPGNGQAKGHAKSQMPHGKAFGKLCQGESKKHAKGQKGTPFSQCVTAIAKLANGTTTSPAKACASMSKKHIKGQKGTPFSVCVSGAKKLLKSEKKVNEPRRGGAAAGQFAPNWLAAVRHPRSGRRPLPGRRSRPGPVFRPGPI